MTARPGHVDIVFDNIGDAQPSRHASNNGARPRKPSSNDYADSPQPNRRKSSDVINFIEYANDAPPCDSPRCDEYAVTPKKPTDRKTVIPQSSDDGLFIEYANDSALSDATALSDAALPSDSSHCDEYVDSPNPTEGKRIVPQAADDELFIEYANDSPLSDSSHCDEYDDSPKKPTEMKTTGIKMTIENDYYD